MKQYKEYLKKYTNYIFLLIIIVIFQTLCIFITPLIIRTILTKIEILKNVNIFYYCLIIFLALVLSLLFNIAFVFLELKFSIKFKTNESKILYNDIFNMKYDIIKKYEPTYFVSRIKTAVDNLFNLVGENLVNAIVSILIIIISLILIFKINISLFVLFLVLPPIILIGYKNLNNKLKEYTIKLQDTCANNYKFTINIMQNINTIKQIYNYNFFSNIIGQYIYDMELDTNKVNKFAQMASYLLEFIINILKITILIVSIYLFLNNKIFISNVIFVQLILDIYFNAINDLKNINLDLRDVHASLDFINNNIKTNFENCGLTELTKINNIKIDCNHFSYNESQEIIKKINFTIHKGDSLAIVGKSGCGKSTLISLLSGLYYSNAIFLNELSINEYTIHSIREKIYTLNQNVELFPFSIKDNITIGLDNFDNDRLDKILNLPFMLEFSQLENGFNTLIKENGANFSGGQKQKIAICRMLMHNPEVIIFDESTSAIDGRSEVQIMNDINYFIKDKIIIKISHRLASIKDSDYIVLLKDGLIDKIGSHSELLDSKEYVELFSSQL